jgi:xanthine dehydrogenase FAD-binding subunit
MSIWSNYVVAENIQSTLDILAQQPGSARPVAGGTDLLLELQQGRHAPIQTLVDITRIPELNCLEIREHPSAGMRLFIGAAVPVREITTSPLVIEHARAVSEACGLIGGPQVRNTATLGGNVAHALPAADGMISLCAMGAEVEIISPDGLRQAPILSLFKGPGQSTLQLEREFLAGFYLPLREPGQASAFSRVMRPQGVALPIINMAIWLERSMHTIQEIRIAIGPSGPVPTRALQLESSLCCHAFDTPDARTAALTKARETIYNSLRFRSNPQRASAAYRYQLSEVLLETVLSSAWDRAGQNLASGQNQ